MSNTKAKLTLLARSIPVLWTLDDNENPIPLQIPAETNPEWFVLQGGNDPWSYSPHQLQLKGYTLVLKEGGRHVHELTDAELAMLADGQRIIFFDQAIIEDVRLNRNNIRNESTLDLVEITKFEHREMTCTFDTMVDSYRGSIIQPLWNSEYGQFPMPSKELQRLIKEDLISSTIHGIWDIEVNFGKSSIILREKLD